MSIVDHLDNGRTKTILGTLFAILILYGALRWAGRTTDSLILSGFAFVVLMFLFFTGQFWWFFVDNPALQKKQQARPLLPPLLYRFTAILFAATTTHLVIGGMWDETWHIIYQLPFGVDLLWPPHLMLYFCFLTILFLGFIAWWLIFFKIKSGTLRQRFIKDPVIGLMLILGQYTLVVLPMDPIWHEWYGADISAWSVPHILLLTGGMGMFFLAFLLMRISAGARRWHRMEFSLRDILNIFVLSSFLFLSYQMLFEYEPYRAATISAELIAQRPAWLLPVLATMLAVSTSTFSARVLRFPFATTLAAFAALVTRNILIAIFSHEGATESSSIAIVILGPALILDLFQWFQQGQTSIPQIGFISGIALFLNYPVYSMWFGVHLSEVAYLLLVAAMIPFSMFVAWLAVGLANFHEDVASTYVTPVSYSQKQIWLSHRLPALLFICNILIICYAIVTAQTPV